MSARTPKPPCGTCDRHNCTDDGHRRVEAVHALSYVVAYAKLVGLLEFHLAEMESLDEDSGRKRQSRVAREVRAKMRAEARASIRKQLSHLAGFTV